MASWVERLQDRLFRESRTMTRPWGPVLRVLRYPAAVLRDWLTGDLGVRATSLAYTTLLSIVPLLVLSFSVLKGLGARANLEYLLHEFFRPMGSAADELTGGVLQFVANMRGDVLGSIGLAFLLYTVISTIEKVETSFNAVWRVERPRSLGRRFTEYLSVMILGPILFAAAIGLLGSAAHSTFGRWLGAVPPLAWAAAVLGHLVPYVVVSAVFTSMYLFIPNTRVEPRAALVGGVTGGIIWGLVGRLFTAFLVYSSHMVAVYTGFAIVLTTLIWVYLSWLILFIGAQLAFYVQYPHCLRYGQGSTDLVGRQRERAALGVMVLLARSYAGGGSLWTGGRLAAELDVPVTAMNSVLAALEREGLVVGADKERWLPARAPESILLGDVLGAVRAPSRGPSLLSPRIPEAADAVMAAVEESASARLAGRSLAHLLAAG